jgi:hypothetical protein
MTAAAASLLRDYFPRHAAKKVARALGVSFQSGRRYVEHPDLFPTSRTEQLLALLKEEQALMEQRVEERRRRLEAIEHEFMASIGMAGSGLDLHEGSNGVRRSRDLVDAARGEGASEGDR